MVCTFIAFALSKWKPISKTWCQLITNIYERDCTNIHPPSSQYLDSHRSVCVSNAVMHKDQVWTAAPEHWPLCLHYSVCFRSLSWCDISSSFRVKEIVLEDFSVFVLHQFAPLPLQVSCWESSSQHDAAATTWNYIFVLMWCVSCSPHVSNLKEKKMLPFGLARPSPIWPLESRLCAFKRGFPFSSPLKSFDW